MPERTVLYVCPMDNTVLQGEKERDDHSVYAHPAKKEGHTVPGDVKYIAYR